MTSQKKIAANRVNAKKSTGPKSARGRALAKYNARKQGLFALQRLIPGEDEKEYEQLSTRLINELAPTCTIEGVLADQIVADVWRLQRLERAERAYLGRVQEAVIARNLRLLADDKVGAIGKCLRSHQPDCACNNAAQPLPRPQLDAGAMPDHKVAENLSYPLDVGWTCKLYRILDVDVSLLEGIVDPARAFAYSSLDQIRRSLVRDILRKHDYLAELQGHQPIVTARRAEE